LYQEGKYLESVGAAQTAIYLRPDFAEAYNNIGAAYAALHLWDPAIQADQQAVRLNPSLQLARNNLAWALTQKSVEKR
jgi:tetratricopeptide (TPR) repeat protein